MGTIMSTYRQKYKNKVVSKLETVDLYAPSNKVQGQFSFIFYAVSFWHMKLVIILLIYHLCVSTLDNNPLCCLRRCYKEFLIFPSAIDLIGRYYQSYVRDPSYKPLSHSFFSNNTIFNLLKSFIANLFIGISHKFNYNLRNRICFSPFLSKVFSRL